MISEGQDIGQGPRAALAALALFVTALIIYALFSSGFGRPQPAGPLPESVPPLPAAPPGASPVAEPARPRTFEVLSGDVWLTYLPGGLARRGGGALAHGG
ncbi:hypothetical protein ITP53_54980, partial [Nonomuraea sp. K274]